MHKLVRGTNSENITQDLKSITVAEYEKYRTCDNIKQKILILNIFIDLFINTWSFLHDLK
jgi:hypothetical protein